MKKIFDSILFAFVIFSLLVGLFLIISGVFNKENQKSEIKLIEQIIYRDTTIYKSKNVYVPTPYPVEVLKYDTIYKTEHIEIDTAAILADYFKEFYYSDTIINDSTALIIIYDTVSKNRISARQWLYQNRRPTVINNFSVAIPKPLRIGVGFQATCNENYFDY